ncbi:MAG TPA: hypothetical protein VFR06_05520 [Gallionellaceae bacterium]|nr:hypothetical protein [Gallionellaceae bacterium]
MSKSAFSLRIFSIYMFALGSALVAAPNLMLSFFGITETHEVWIRVVGVPVLIIGYLDFMCHLAQREGQPRSVLLLNLNVRHYPKMFCFYQIDIDFV